VQLPGPDPEVVDLEASAGRVEVIVGTDCLATNGCRDQLWQSPAGSDRFAAIPGVDLSGASFDVGDLSLHADIGYLVGRSTDASNGHEISLLWRTADGVHWVHAPTVCPGTLAITSVAAVDVNRAALLCSGNAATGNTTKELYATSDGGRTWVPEGTQAPLGGDGGTLSAATVSTLAIATSSGASDIYLSTNGGAGWQTVLSVDDGGAGWGDFGFRNASDGFAVHAPISRVWARSTAPPTAGSPGRSRPSEGPCHRRRPQADGRATTTRRSATKETPHIPQLRHHLSKSTASAPVPPYAAAGCGG
jgi:hypothetical protein